MNKILNLPLVDLIPCAEIDEKRNALLVTSAPAWNAVKGQLRGLNLAAIVEATEATTYHWDSLLSSPAMAQFEIVYAVGGGLSADAAKYLAAKLDLPLTVIPTALSVDAFITAASGIRRNGCVYYIPTKVPEKIILDFEVIAGAPASIRAAGITDVLSISTGCWDWKFAHEKGMNPQGMEFIPWVYENAQSILGGVLDCAEAAGGGDHDGLKTLYDCLAMEVQLTNQIGHSRPEEGSEHYFAYAIENEVGHGRPHADLVCPGILLMGRAQGQEMSALSRAMEACSVTLGSIPERLVEKTLNQLPDFCRRHDLPFGIAHVLDQGQISALMMG